MTPTLTYDRVHRGYVFQRYPKKIVTAWSGISQELPDKTARHSRVDRLQNMYILMVGSFVKNVCSNCHSLATPIFISKTLQPTELLIP